MNPERWQQIKQLYNSALEIEPDRQKAFLDEACAPRRAKGDFSFTVKQDFLHRLDPVRHSGK